MNKIADCKFGILAWPAYSTKKENPYNYLIYKEIERKGFSVYEFEFNIKNIAKYLFSNKYKVFHIHWPTNILTYSSYIQAKRRVIILKYFLKLIKLFNKKVVWTVHNLQGHDADHPSLQKELNKILYSNVDGFISLNKSGISYIEEQALNKKFQKIEYIPHPSYSEYYPNIISRENARKQLNIPADSFVFLFLGQIRKYKNVMGLVKAYKELAKSNKFLLIAGKVHEEIEEELIKETNNQSNIILKDSFIADEDLQVYLNSCDVVVTPYSNIFNSGSVYLNLSFNKPTLAPEKGIFKELMTEFGTDLITLYKKDISFTDLSNCMDKKQQHIHLKIDLSVISPARIAEKTLYFYKSLL